jgi:RimJ/RimL family protein N-acetyltransferase
MSGSCEWQKARANERVQERMRGAWFHRGRHHDVLVYALLREEFDAARPATAP